jgi:hypothetical protein
MGIFGVMGVRNLYPTAPEPILLTPMQLREKVKQKSVSDICKKNKKQSNTVKDLCKRWGKDD